MTNNFRNISETKKKEKRKEELQRHDSVYYTACRHAHLPEYSKRAFVECQRAIGSNTRSSKRLDIKVAIRQPILLMMINRLMHRV